MANKYKKKLAVAALVFTSAIEIPITLGAMKEFGETKTETDYIASKVGRVEYDNQFIAESIKLLKTESLSERNTTINLMNDMQDDAKKLNTELLADSKKETDGIAKSTILSILSTIDGVAIFASLVALKRKEDPVAADAIGSGIVTGN